MNVVSVQKLLERAKAKHFAFEKDRELIIELCETYLKLRTLDIEVVNDGLSRIRFNNYVVAEIYTEESVENNDKSKTCYSYSARFDEDAISNQADIATVISWLITKARDYNYYFPSNS